MIERRRYPRFELRVQAKYRVMDPKEFCSVGSTRNISAEGICFESDELLRLGVYVQLEVNLGDEESTASLIGKVAWSSEIKNVALKKKKYVNGLKLIDIPKTDETRFLKFYCRKLTEKLRELSKD
ncbi:PilZ domain-containing protein [Candidatus Omnitrophota bacterium]